MAKVESRDGVPTPGKLSPLLARLRRRMAHKLLTKGRQQGAIADIGCGTEPVFLRQTSFATRYGIDRYVESGTAEDGIILLQHDLESGQQLPLKDTSLDTATALAVLEHIDTAALPHLLADIHRTLKPGGCLIFTVPSPTGDRLLGLLAHIGLASKHNLEEHQDRYTRQKLRTLLEAAGFLPEDIQLGHFELGLNIWGRAWRR